MTEKGLVPVKNPSHLFLSTQAQPYSGTAVIAVLQGQRALLVETQALVAEAIYPSGQRTATGFPVKRLHMLLAVLEKHTKLQLADKDIFVNIAGGLKLSEPAADLGIFWAVYSSYYELALSVPVAFAGEISLTGEIRSVTARLARIIEADRLGIPHFFCAPFSEALPKDIKIKIHSVRNVQEFIERIRFFVET